MKAALLILSVLIFNTFTGNAKTLPDAVSKAFAEKFAKAEKVKWDQENVNEWEAEFILGGKEMSASFDPSGKWLETETEIEKNELPAAVRQNLKMEFSGAKLGETAIIDSPEFNGYEIELKFKGKNMEVQVTADGKIHKKTVEKNND